MSVHRIVVAMRGMHYEWRSSNTHKKKKRNKKKKRKKEMEGKKSISIVRPSIFESIEAQDIPHISPHSHRLRACCCHTASGTSSSSPPCTDPDLATATCPSATRGLLAAPGGGNACTLCALRPGTRPVVCDATAVATAVAECERAGGRTSAVVGRPGGVLLPAADGGT